MKIKADGILARDKPKTTGHRNRAPPAVCLSDYHCYCWRFDLIVYGCLYGTRSFFGTRESRRSRHAPVTMQEPATLKAGKGELKMGTSIKSTTEPYRMRS